MLSREGPQARMVEMMVEHKQERKGGEYWEVAQVVTYKQINKCKNNKHKQTPKSNTYKKHKRERKGGEDWEVAQVLK